MTVVLRGCVRYANNPETHTTRVVRTERASGCLFWVAMPRRCIAANATEQGWPERQRPKTTLTTRASEPSARRDDRRDAAQRPSQPITTALLFRWFAQGLLCHLVL